MDLLVVGGTGLLGREVTRQARQAGHRVVATFHRHAPLAGDEQWRHLDIRRRGAVAALVGAVRPDVIVNAAFRPALVELAGSSYRGVHHVAGADAVSRHELGVLIARRDGLDETTLPTGRRAGTGLPGAVDVRLDCAWTSSRLTTRLRGARSFLRP